MRLSFSVFRFFYAIRYTTRVPFKRAARKDYTEETLYDYAL